MPKTYKEKRSAKIDRFNMPLGTDTFLNDFQKVMIERMLLNYEKKFHPKNVKRIIKNVTDRHPKSINTDISSGLLLSCNIDPTVYIFIQEINKELFGNYMPMDHIIQELLIWYVYYYKNYLRGKKNMKPPFVFIKKEKKDANLIEFEKKFKRYYKNI